MANKITQEQFTEWLDSQPQEKRLFIADYCATTLDNEHGKTHALNCMRERRRMFEESGIPFEKNLEKCTLYDMSNCVLVGSGRCEKCLGLIGRGIDNED